MSTEIEPGTYAGVLQEVGMDRSKNDIPLVYSIWEVAGARRTIRWYLGCRKKDTDAVGDYDARLRKVIEISKGKLAAVEFNENWDVPAFGVTEFPLYCKHESYQGEMQERWDISTRREPTAPDADVMASMRDIYNDIDVTAAKAADLPAGDLKDEAYQRAWAAYCSNHEDQSQEQLRNGFNGLIRETVDKPAEECTVSDWEHVEAAGAF